MLEKYWKGMVADWNIKLNMFEKFQHSMSLFYKSGWVNSLDAWVGFLLIINKQELAVHSFVHVHHQLSCQASERKSAKKRPQSTILKENVNTCTLFLAQINTDFIFLLGWGWTKASLMMKGLAQKAESNLA